MLQTHLARAAARHSPQQMGVSGDTSTISSSSATVANDGTTTVTITVVAFDSDGVPISGATVAASATGSGNTLSTPTTTSVSGFSTFTFKTTGASAHVISVVINNVPVAATTTVTASGASTIDRTTSTVTVSPASADTGNTAVITLQAQDSAGVNLTTGGSTIAFGHTGGTSAVTIGSVTDNGNGTYTATLTSVTAGTATTLSATIGGLSVTTTMPTFTATAAAGSNEPAGLTAFGERYFNAKVEAGWQDRGDTRFSIVTDATAPVSPGNVGQALFPAGWGSPNHIGEGPIWVNRDVANYGTLYMRFPFKVSSNWYGHSTGVNKVIFILIGGQPRVFLDCHGVGSGGALTMSVQLQSDPNNVIGPIPGTIGSNANIVRNTWYTIEVELIANQNATNNGTAKVWINGTLAITNTALQFATGAQGLVFQEVRWNPTWGGQGSDSIPSDQQMWIDHFYLSGKVAGA